MQSVPYIGVTGFMHSHEVATLLEGFPHHIKRRLMVGVLAGFKSLRNIPLKPRWAQQYPKPQAIAELFTNDPRALNLIHFGSEEGQEKTVLHDLLELHVHGGPNLHGFQLNLIWPTPDMLYQYRQHAGAKPRLVLQVGTKSVELAGGTPDGVIARLVDYRGLINDVLLDPSGGFGKPLETKLAYQFLAAIADQGWDFLGIGVAGGLGPDSLDLVQPFVQEFSRLSIDEQGKLRDAENNLDLAAAVKYRDKALRMFA